MRGAAQRYRELMVEWDLDRALAGGTLSQEEEARHADELDRCWLAMSEEEQDEYEREREQRRTSLRAPAALDEQDEKVQRGTVALPRRKVAA